MIVNFAMFVVVSLVLMVTSLSAKGGLSTSHSSTLYSDAVVSSCASADDAEPNVRPIIAAASSVLGVLIILWIQLLVWVLLFAAEYRKKPQPCRYQHHSKVSVVEGDCKTRLTVKCI